MADNEDEGIALAAEDPAVMKDYDDTYLSELTEKTSLENGDIFLVRGTDNQDYKIKLAAQVDNKINGALADYTKIVKVNVSDTTLDTLKTALLDNIANLNNGDIIHIYRDTQKRAILILNKQSNIYFDVTITSFYYTENELRYNNGTWQDSYVMNNALASYKKIETKEVTATVDVNGNINTPLTDLFSIVSVSGSNKMYIPFKYSTYWVLYCMNVGGSKVASGTELTVTIKYFQN